MNKKKRMKLVKFWGRSVYMDIERVVDNGGNLYETSKNEHEILMETIRGGLFRNIEAM